MCLATMILHILVVLFLHQVTCKDLHHLKVLVLVPFPDSNGTNGWDRGLELLPAARVAAREINSDNYTLPGYYLELVERASDPCGESVITKGLINLIANAIEASNENSSNAISVLGLACSTVTASVSPIAGRKEVNLLQLSMANSNRLRDFDTYPHLWRFLASSDQHVFATIALMEHIEWSRVGLIFDGQGVFFNALASSFRRKVGTKNYSLLLDQGIASSSDSVNSALNLVQSHGIRIIFAPTTIPESVEIMCQAAKRNLVWPGYVWIFPARRYNEFYDNRGNCDRPDMLLDAIENVITTKLNIENTNLSSVLLTGRTYSEYLTEYYNESEKLQNEEKYAELLQHFTFTTDNPYANMMYNEVWALALALNESMPEIADRGFALQDYQYGHSEITNIIEKHLKNVSFQGTLGRVEFDENREVPTTVGIFQISNGNETEIAVVHDELLNFFGFARNDDTPNDEFERQYNLITDGLAITIYVQSSLLLFFVTVMLCLVVLLRKEPEVRASSPLLSLHIFIGCYMLIVASVLLITRQYIVMPKRLYQVMCYVSDIFFVIGTNLITTSVMLRLARVYRIFTKVEKISWVWKNKPLFVFAIVIAVLPIIFTVVELGIGPRKYVEDVQVNVDVNPPVMEITIRCSSTYANAFEAIHILCVVLLMFVLLAFAVLTRNVDKKHFNDFKKVAAFVFLFTLFGTVLIPVSYVLKSLGNSNDSAVVLSYVNHLLIVVSQLFLIVPKVIPTFYYRYLKNEERNVYELKEEDATISKFIISPVAKKLNLTFATVSNEDKSSFTIF